MEFTYGFMLDAELIKMMRIIFVNYSWEHEWLS